MTQEDKQLLFKDLCARVPYHVKVKVWLNDGLTEEGELDLEHNYGDVLRDAFYLDEIKDIKPYLRPMSSMTDEEDKKRIQLGIWRSSQVKGYEVTGITNDYGYSGSQGFQNALNFLLENHFDIFGLIPKGLAIEVTKENNPYKD